MGPERPPEIPGVEWVNVGPCPECGGDWWLADEDGDPLAVALLAELLEVCSDCRGAS